MADVIQRVERTGLHVSKEDLELYLIHCLKAESKPNLNVSELIDDAAHRLTQFDSPLSLQVYLHIARAATRKQEPEKAIAALDFLLYGDHGLPMDIPHYFFRPILAPIIQQAASRNDTFSLSKTLPMVLDLRMAAPSGPLSLALPVAANEGNGKLADTIVECMIRSKLPLHEEHLSSRVFAHARAGDVTKAVVVLQDMSRQQMRLAPDACRELSVALNSYWRTIPDLDTSSMLEMNELIPGGGAIPVDLFNATLTMYAWNGFYPAAELLMRTGPMMFGIQPNADSYAALLLSCAFPLRVRVTEALNIAEEMQEKGIPLNSACYSSLSLCLLRSRGHTLEQAWVLVEQAAEQGHPVSRDVCERFYRACARQGNFEGLKRVKGHMLDHDYHLTQRSLAYGTKQQKEASLAEAEEEARVAAAAAAVAAKEAAVAASVEAGEGSEDDGGSEGEGRGGGTEDIDSDSDSDSDGDSDSEPKM